LPRPLSTLSMTSIRSRVRDCGYARVPLGIDSKLIASLAARVYERVGASPQVPSTWAALPNASRGFVPLWNDKILWRIRAQAALLAVFAELFETEDLWVSIDRCHFKPPVEVDPELGAQHFIHWDSDPSDPLFAPYQAAIALTDTPYDQGAFVCSPDAYRFLRDGDHETAGRLRQRGDFDVISVGCRAGDLIVWDHRLLHGNSANVGIAPRLAMYVTMQRSGTEDQRKRRTSFWKSGEWPGGPSRYPGFDRPDVPAPSLQDFWTPALGLDAP